jgi:deoxyribodipyrimidine photo-lyase
MKTLCWIRRDLRLHDHAALSWALSQGETTVVFVFDTYILDKLKDKSDQRVSFIYDSLLELESELNKKGSSLIIAYGKPEGEIPRIAKELGVSAVACNRDYEPYAKKRDGMVATALGDIKFEQFKDSVIFEKHEVLNGKGEIYKVFTPYKNKWLQTLASQEDEVPEHKVSLKNVRQFKNPKSIATFDWYKVMGFNPTPPTLKAGTKVARKRLSDFTDRISKYKASRDVPSIDGTSLISVYIRHGNISVRDLVRIGSAHRDEGSKTWLSELVWRDFYFVIMDAHPGVENHAYKPEYEKIKWLGSKKDFQAWCDGQTGFPIIDAAMRCLKETGLMHNRLRMVTASFLCKILLVDWKLGEHYFADKLLDYDLAANNGGWQWSSSSGVDAQPYFRIFNPYAQSDKFDKQGEFIKKWVPELAEAKGKDIHKPDPDKFSEYPEPIVDYSTNRERCLVMYRVVRK